MPQTNPILFAIETLSVGGAERVVINLANGLDRSRWAPHVVCLSTAGDLAQDLDDVPLHVLDKRPGLDFSIFGKLRRLADEIRPVLINTHLWTANTWTRAALGRRLPIVVTEHNRDIWKDWYHRAIDRWLAKRTAALVAVSEDAAAFYRDTVGVPAGLIRVIRNGIDVKRYAQGKGEAIRTELGIPDDAFLIGSVGRLVPQKNYGRLIDAFAILLKDHPRCRLILFGDGPERDLLHAKAVDNGSISRIVFAGTRGDIPDCLAALDLFILSSDREGHPLTALEAQAAGVPIVLTNVGGSGEAIARKGQDMAGILVHPDAQALAVAMVDLVGNKDKRRRMGALARVIAAEQFDTTHMLGAYISVFEEFMDRTG